jgi:hypothetical protein
MPGRTGGSGGRELGRTGFQGRRDSTKNESLGGAARRHSLGPLPSARGSPPPPGAFGGVPGPASPRTHTPGKPSRPRSSSSFFARFVASRSPTRAWVGGKQPVPQVPLLLGVKHARGSLRGPRNAQVGQQGDVVAAVALASTLGVIQLSSSPSSSSSSSPSSSSSSSSSPSSSSSSSSSSYAAAAARDATAATLCPEPMPRAVRTVERSAEGRKECRQAGGQAAAAARRRARFEACRRPFWAWAAVVVGWLVAVAVAVDAVAVVDGAVSVPCAMR